MPPDIMEYERYSISYENCWQIFKIASNQDSTNLKGIKNYIKTHYGHAVRKIHNVGNSIGSMTLFVQDINGKKN